MTDSVTDPAPPPPPSRHYPLRVLLLFGAIALILFARSYTAFVYPILFCEDGTIMYGYYVGNPDPARLLSPYAGYVSLVPNAICYAASNLSPAYAPYLFAAAALLVAAAAMTLFSLRRFRGVLQHDTARMAVCLLLAAWPIGNYALVSLATYSLWYLLLALLLLAAAPLPRSRAAVAAQFAFMALAAWSHPLSVVVVPLCAYLLLVRKTLADRLVNAGLIVAVVLYVAFGVTRRGESDFSPQAVSTTCVYLAHRVLFEAFFGNRMRLILRARGYGWLIVAAAAGALLAINLLLWLARSRLTRTHWRQLAGVSAFVVALTFLGVVARNMTPTSHLVSWNHRYFYLQQYAVLLVAAVGVAHLLQVPRWADLGRRWAAPAGVALLAYAVGTNLHNRQFYLTSPEESRRITAFTKQVAEQLRRPVGRRGARELVLERGKWWDIRVDLSGEPSPVAPRGSPFDADGTPPQ